MKAAALLLIGAALAGADGFSLPKLIAMQAEARERERARARRFDLEGRAAAGKGAAIPALVPTLPPDERERLVEALKNAPEPTGKLTPVTLNNGRVLYVPEIK